MLASYVLNTWGLVRCGIAIFITAATLSAQATIIEYSIPTTDSKPACITVGPDGNLWFTESGANKIGTVTANGELKEFVLPTPNSQPWGIAAGSDGNLWFSEISANKIGKITTTGSVTEYPLPSAVAFGAPRYPIGITAGSDGNLWYADQNSGMIGRVTTAGAITEYRTPENDAGSLNEIVADTDGSLWFSGSKAIGRIDAAGVITVYPLVIGIRVDRIDLRGIAKGPDGGVWIAGGGFIWRVGTNGAVRMYSGGADGGIASGIHDDLWSTNSASNKIARVKTDGTVTQYSIPTDGSLEGHIWAGSVPGSITAGPDGNIWFTEPSGNKVAKLILASLPPADIPDIAPASLTFSKLSLANPPASQILTVGAPPSTAYSVSAGVFVSAGPPWLTVSPSGALGGNQALTASIGQFNFGTFGGYSGNIVVKTANATRSIPVTLTITRPLGPQRITAVGNAASYAGAAIVPGQIVSIFGTSLGPANPLGLSVEPTGKVAKVLSGVSVGFNGVLAPLTYVSSTQINCVVPYEIAGSSSVTVEVYNQLNQTSPPYSVRADNFAPGIFTRDGSGSGQVAAINGSGGLNGSDNPARAGEALTFYVTGEGLTFPGGTTGAVTRVNTLATGPLTPQPKVPVSVAIGGKPAIVTFYGEAPGFVAGLMQVNAQIPDGLSTGNQALTVSMGDAQSQSAVTVAVR